MLLSVIIPVYNGEKYITECLNSIKKQINDDVRDKVEVITVNDGSKDRSLSILSEYHIDNTWLKVIDKQNGGVSSARNEGLENAVGKYVTFVDIDDTLAPGAIGRILETVGETEADIYIGDYYEVAENNEILRTKAVGSIVDNDRKKLDRELLLGYFINACWGKIYRSDIIKTNKLRFPTDIKIGEDLLFVAEYLKYVKNVCSIKTCIYNYRQLDNGTVVRNRSRLDENNISDFIRTLKCKQGYASFVKISEREYQELLEEFSNMISGNLNLMLKSDYSLREKIVKADRFINEKYIFNIIEEVSKDKNVNLKRRISNKVVMNKFTRNLYVIIKHYLKK